MLGVKKNMSSIPFLENASEGKNNWWRYLLTVIVSLVGGSLVAGIAWQCLSFIPFFIIQTEYQISLINYIQTAFSIHLLL